MIKMKLMADYGCHPLWGTLENAQSNIDPNDLPVSNDLKTRLSNWAQKFDQTLDQEYPPNSGFKTESDEEEFKREAVELAEELRKELGPAFEIIVQI